MSRAGPPEGRALPAHRLVQAARRAQGARLARRPPSGASGRDRDLGPQPRAGARLGRSVRRGLSALGRDVEPGASPTKIAATRGYGAEVDLEAAGPGRRLRPARESSTRQAGLTLVHPFDDPLVDRGPGNGRARAGGGPFRGCRSSSSLSAAAASSTGIAAALPEVRRVVAVEPELSTALRQRARGRAGRCRVEPRSVADGLSAPFAGAEALAQFLPREPRREACWCPRRRSSDGFPLPLRAGKARVRAGRRRSALRRSSPGRSPCNRDDTVGVGISGGNADAPKCAPGILGSGHQDRTSTRTTCSRHVRCACGNEFHHALDEVGAARRDLLRVSPLLHGQAEARGHRRPRGALPQRRLETRLRRQFAASGTGAGELRWATIGGQAVLEGVMMRTPSNWAVAVRKPDGESPK